MVKMRLSEYKITPAKAIHVDFNEIWRYRELFYFFIWRDIKVKYKQTVLGLLWALLQPLALMILFSVVWLKALKLSTTEIPYPIFAYSGLVFWGLFSDTITNAGNSMITNSPVIKKIYFPRIIIPVSSALTALFDFFITLFLLFVLLFYFRMDVNIPVFLICLPLSIMITSAASLGLGFMAASANITYRDFRYVIPFLLRIFFFVSPVVIPFSVIESDTTQFILSLNPLAGAIGLIRAAISGNEINITLTLKSIMISLLLFAIGTVTFKKSERYSADLL